MPDIELSFFGPPQIALEGMPVATQRRKSLALLVYLAVTQQSHARDTLTATFWPDADQSHGRTVLRSVLADLRRTIGHSALIASGDQIALRCGPNLTVDVVRFRALAAQVAAHHPAGAALCDDCLNALSEAVGLYRADFLAGFTLDDVAGFDMWQTQQTETLRLQLADALECLASGLAEHRQIEAAITHARRWCDLDPLNEAAHRLVMQLHAQASERGAAVRQYEQCVQLLAEELGVEPEPATTALYEALRSGNAATQTTMLPLPRSPAPAHNLPPDLTPFIGRETELAQVGARLVDPGCRLLTVLGPGGIGKTRLAIQAARSTSERFAHGACFVDLSPLTSADFLSAAILQALHAPRSATDPDKTLLDFLADKRLLLVLDNYEHLLSGPDDNLRDGYGLVTKLVAAAPDVKLLITSRSRLNVTAEWLAPLGGMQTPPEQLPHDDAGANGSLTGTSGRTWSAAMPEETPESLSEPVQSLAHYSATALFLACVRRLRPDFVPTGDEVRTIGRICRMLGGMPLGIELAAAWIRMLSLAEIASRLERGMDLLRSTARDVPARHRSITAAFDYSWRMLSSQERSILRQLALFCGGCTVEAATAVTGATLLDLASLADKSWLRIEPSGQGPEASNRCTLHALVHQYCAEKLAVEHAREAREPLDQARDRHTAYYLARLKARREIVTTWQDRFLPLLADLDNYNAIWRRAIEGNRFETLRDLFAVVGYPDASARTQLQLLEQAQHVLQARLKTSAATDPSCEATLCLIELLRHRAGCFSRLGQLTRAAADLETSLGLVDAVARAPGSIEARFRLRHAQTFLLQDRGDFAAALQLRRALLTELPDIHAHLWPYQPDRTLIYWQTEITSALFYPLFCLGQYAEAEVAVRQALQWFESLPWACNANALANLGLLCHVRGNYSEALRLAAESLRANQTHGQRGYSLYSLQTMAQAEIALGRLMEATTHYRQAIAGARACDRPAAIARGMMGLAEVELAMNRPDKAKEAYEAVITYCEQNGLEWGDIQAVALIGAGRTACMLSDPATAEESFARALRCRGCSATDLMEALAGLAQVRVMRGARAGAIELLAFVIAHPFTSHRVRQPMIRLLAKLEGEQSPEVFAAAVARGRGRGLEELVTELSRGR